MKSKYPPAEPGALRLLAPQRGLIAIGQDQNQNNRCSIHRKDLYCRHSCESRNPVFSGFRVAFHLPGMTILLPELSTPYSIRGPRHSRGFTLRKLTNNPRSGLLEQSMRRNSRKVSIQSFHGNFYSFGGTFLINGRGLHWSYQVLIKTKPPEH